MAKNRAEGNRVYVDDLVYIVSTAGAGQYSVADDFGGKLGYFAVRGRAITPEDYGVEGVPPIMVIAKLWVAANLVQDDKPAPLVSKGVCQVSTTEGATDEGLSAARAHRAWLKKQPGMKASYLVRDPASGKAITIAIWQSRAQLDAAAAASGAEGAPLQAATTEIFPFVEEP